MNVTQLRAELANRLQGEINRKGKKQNSIANESGLTPDVVSQYLSGKREVNFNELREICACLKINLMWLLSPNYKPSPLTFRALPDQDLSKVSHIENALLIISDIFPKIKNFPIEKLSNDDEIIIQSEINNIASDLLLKYRTVEQLYDAAKLHILPVSAGDQGFDAFIMNKDNFSVVCINRDKPTTRIHFSLLHEMAHFLWHRNQEMPVDLSISDFFGTQQSITEFVANKFAQQFIFPYSETEKLVRNWKENTNLNDLITERRTSADVLAFAIFDIVKHDKNKISFSEIKNNIKSRVNAGLQDDSILKFIEYRGNDFKNVIRKNRDEFSDNVWEEIETSLELNVG